MAFDYASFAPQKIVLANGVEVYSFVDKSSELLRLELIVNAGSIWQSKPLQARAAASLLEASSKHTSKEINERLDFYGAYVEKSVDKDEVSIVVYSRAKYAKEIIAIFEEVLKDALYTQKELDLYLSKEKSRFEIDSTKVSFISKRAFFENLFGAEHPYGLCVKAEDFSALELCDLEEFYRQRYVKENFCVVLSGNVNDEVLKAVETCFGVGLRSVGERAAMAECAGVAGCGTACGGDKAGSGVSATFSKPVYINKEGAVQSSLRMGRVVMQPQSEDFYAFKVLDYVFGGYFGSRIMKNIREDKGYTYGISSFILPMREASVWVVGSELKKSYAAQTKAEIEKEMKKLCDKKISAKELDLVRNVYKGEFLREMDGILDISEKWKFLRSFSMDFDFYRKMEEVIDSISAEEIREAARKYFDPKAILTVVAGCDEAGF